MWISAVETASANQQRINCDADIRTSRDLHHQDSWESTELLWQAVQNSPGVRCALRHFPFCFLSFSPFFVLLTTADLRSRIRPSRCAIFFSWGTGLENWRHLLFNSSRRMETRIISHFLLRYIRMETRWCKSQMFTLLTNSALNFLFQLFGDTSLHPKSSYIIFQHNTWTWTHFSKIMPFKIMRVASYYSGTRLTEGWLVCAVWERTVNGLIYLIGQFTVNRDILTDFPVTFSPCQTG